MNTEQVLKSQSLKFDMADELAAGRPFPARPRVIRDHAMAAAWLREVHAFWLDAAAGYLALAEAGCTDSVHDVRESLAAAEGVAPRGAR